jgi:hypothetical protein
MEDESLTFSKYYIKIKFVPQRKHIIYPLFKERIYMYCDNITEHINTICVQYADFNMLKHVIHIVITEL